MIVRRLKRFIRVGLKISKPSKGFGKLLQQVSLASRGELFAYARALNAKELGQAQFCLFN